MRTTDRQIHDMKNGLTYARHNEYSLPTLNLSEADKTGSAVLCMT